MTAESDTPICHTPKSLALVNAEYRVQALQAENEALRALLRDAHLRFSPYMRSGTHWDGCESAHNDCALLKRIDAALAQREGTP